MKLLLDENLSPRMVESLADVYSVLEHVHHCDLGGADDKEIWDYAKDHEFAIVTKDSDFAERSVLAKDPPKIIWIRIGNCSTTEIETLLRSANAMIRSFIEDNVETCLLLGIRR